MSEEWAYWAGGPDRLAFLGEPFECECGHFAVDEFDYPYLVSAETRCPSCGLKIVFLPKETPK